MERESRKLEHIKYAVKTGDGPGINGFEDIHLIHNCLPSIDFAKLSLSTCLADINLYNPIIINAITGGDTAVSELNGKLASVASKTKCAMAVGSQYVAIKNNEVRKSYEIVREKNPEGIIFANIGAYASPSEAVEVVKMIDAQALQIHLNPAQEMFMREGDRDFTNYLNNIKKIISTVSVPVIIKETGAGISMEAANELVNSGVKIIDVSGVGGSNFINIEASRYNKKLDNDILSWGIPTAISVIEVAQTVYDRASIVSSGGVRTALDIIKALTIGANAIGMAGNFLQILLKDGEDVLYKNIISLLEDVKKIMFLVNAENIDDLHKIPFIVTGFSQTWLEARGIKTAKFAQYRG